MPSPDPSESAAPLAPAPPLRFRGYRRHRKHARLGVASLACPPLLVGWATFWWLKLQDAGAARVGGLMPTAGWMLLGGCVVIAAIGVMLAVAGLATRHRRKRWAAVGLAANSLCLVGSGIWLLLRAALQGAS